MIENPLFWGSVSCSAFRNIVPLITCKFFIVMRRLDSAECASMLREEQFPSTKKRVSVERLAFDALRDRILIAWFEAIQILSVTDAYVCCPDLRFCRHPLQNQNRCVNFTHRFLQFSGTVPDSEIVCMCRSKCRSFSSRVADLWKCKEMAQDRRKLALMEIFHERVPCVASGTSSPLPYSLPLAGQGYKKSKDILHNRYVTDFESVFCQTIVCTSVVKRGSDAKDQNYG